MLWVIGHFDWPDLEFIIKHICIYKDYKIQSQMTLVENVHHHTPCPPSDSLPRGTTRRSAALLISSDKWWDPPFCFSITWRIWYWYIKQSLLFVTHSKNLVTSVIKPSKKRTDLHLEHIKREWNYQQHFFYWPLGLILLAN